MAVAETIEHQYRVRIGAIIRNARESKGWSRAQLGSKIKKSQQAIYNYENAERPILAEDLPVFAAVLGIPLSSFTEQYDEVDEEDTQAIHWYRGLPPNLRRVARRQLQALYDEHERDGAA